MDGGLEKRKKNLVMATNCWSGVLVEQKLETRSGRNFFARSFAYRAVECKSDGDQQRSANCFGGGTGSSYVDAQLQSFEEHNTNRVRVQRSSWKRLIYYQWPTTRGKASYERVEGASESHSAAETGEGVAGGWSSWKAGGRCAAYARDETESARGEGEWE